MNLRGPAVSGRVRGLVLVAVSLALGSRPVDAAGRDAAPTAEADVRMSFSDAVEQLERGEPRRAIETLDRARLLAQKIADPELRALILHRLDFESARAYLSVTPPTPEELTRAEDALSRFLVEEDDPDRRALASGLLDEVRQRRASLTTEPVDTMVAADPVKNRVETPMPPPPRVPLRSSTMEILGDARAAPPRLSAKVATRLKIGGGVMLGSAAASLAVMIVGVVLAQRAETDYRAGPSRNLRDDALQRGRVANGWIAGGAVMSGVLIVGGSTMLTLGALRRRRGFSATRPAL